MPDEKKKCVNKTESAQSIGRKNLFNLRPLSFNVWMKNFRALWFNRKLVDFEVRSAITSVSGCNIACDFFSRQILAISL